MKNRIIRDSEIVSNMVCPDVKPTCETKESDNHTTMLHDCKVSFGLHYMQRMILLMIHDGKSQMATYYTDYTFKCQMYQQPSQYVKHV